MISPIQTGKTYGVLHKESYFSFLGFAKKVGSEETQKIDVFLDDKLIDTILANEFIQKIDDMYDVESKAFKYNLPSEYIGKKAIISFKNHDTQDELLNSPYTLIDKNHEKFNEAKFLHSLEGNFDNEKIQNINPKDSIGFLSTEDNLLNKDLIKLINIFLEKNIDSRFKVFYFNNEQKKLISEKFNKYLSKIDFIMTKDIYDIANNTSIYIHSSTENEKPKDTGYYKIWQVLNQIKANMFLINIFEEIDDKEYSKSLKLLDNCKIEFEKSIVSKIFETDERYNEFKFINSINQPISEEMKNMYCQNSIGFLATKENFEDEEFVEYINEIIKDFPEYDFKALYFDKNSIKEIKNKFQHSNLNLIELKSAKDIFENLEVYLSNYEKTFKDRFEMPIMNLLRYKSNDIALLPLGLNRDKYLTLREFENQNKAYFKKLLDNLEYLGFNKDDINKYGNSFNTINFKSASKRNRIDIDFNLSETLRKAYVYYNLKLGYKNHNYFEEIINRIKKIIEVQK
ncbi:hypothetical protein NG774_05125 [Aliarcobacter cryaerophilus]|uniref:hypothetical protein n=1 Tax=Aliarcobacter cryaerophilus TaxID=28198 RepID=UPI003DA65534